MKNYLLGITSLLIAITLTACVDNNTTEKSKIETKQTEEQIKGPHYSVKIWLSKKAQEAMQEKNESIIISSMFDGDGQAKPNVKSAPFRDVYLGAFNKEIQLNETAIFNDIVFSKTDIKRLDKSYGLLINVISGRKSSNNNLLSCASPYYDVKYLLDDPEATLITINCGLIGENNNYKPAFITTSKNPSVNIKPNQTITSPLKIEVNSQGLWGGFEGEIGTVQLLDKDKNNLGYAILSALDENWMREGNVRYSGNLTFKAKKSGKGILRFFNNNPSESEGVHRYFDIPVQISVENTKP